MLVVQGSAGAESLMQVVRVPAPAIRFTALVQPDPSHAVPVTSPWDGYLLHITPEGHARGGQSVAVLRSGSDSATREVGLPAPTDGEWRPRRSAGQFVIRGDTVGVVREHGTWLAVGTVSDIEYGVVHERDPATVLVGGDRERAGRVETVYPPGVVYPYSAQVAVEFAGPEGPWNAATHEASVVVTPTGPRDSLLAVPASAVVRFASGDAVFVPKGPGRYRVQWVTTGPRAGHMITVRDGLEAGTSVVGGVATLAAAARDSLLARLVRHRKPL